MGKPIETLKALTAFNHEIRPVGKIWERWEFSQPHCLQKNIFDIIQFVLFSKECILCMVLHLAVYDIVASELLVPTNFKTVPPGLRGI